MRSRDNALFTRIERENHVLLLVLNYAKASLCPQPQTNILRVRQLETCDQQSITLYDESPVYSHMVLLKYSSLEWVGIPPLGRGHPPGRSLKAD